MKKTNAAMVEGGIAANSRSGNASLGSFAFNLWAVAPVLPTFLVRALALVYTRVRYNI